MVFELAAVIYRFLSGGDTYSIGFNSDFFSVITKWLLSLLSAFGGGYTAADVNGYTIYPSNSQFFRAMLAMISFVIALIVVIYILNLIFKFVKYLLYYMGGLFRI